MFFKFTPKESIESRIGYVKAQNLFNTNGKRFKKPKTNALAKLDEFLKDFPLHDETKPCHADILPLEESKKAENYVTSQGNHLNPKWYAKFVWFGNEAPYATTKVPTTLKATNADSGESTGQVFEL